MLKATQHFSDTGGTRTQVTTFIPTWSFLLPFRAFFLGPGQTLLCPSDHQKVPLHLSQYLIFGVGVGAGGQACSSAHAQLSCLSYPCPHIAFGSLSSWSSWALLWAPSTSPTAPFPTVSGLGGEGLGLPGEGGGCSSLWPADPRLLAGSSAPT